MMSDFEDEDILKLYFQTFIRDLSDEQVITIISIASFFFFFLILLFNQTKNKQKLVYIQWLGSIITCFAKYR